MSEPVLILQHNSGVGGYNGENFTIRIFFDGTYYQIKMNVAYYNTHRYPDSFEINNIPYIRKDILQIIKLINIDPNNIGYSGTNILNILKQILTLPLMDDEINLQNNHLKKVIDDLQNKNYELKNNCKLELDELNKKNDELKNNYNLELDELKIINDELKNNYKLEIDELNKKNKLYIDELEIKNKLQNNKVMSEFRENINRYCEIINNEKLKNKKLNDALNDITLLYENLLNTTY